jgi:hypothetical protein
MDRDTSSSNPADLHDVAAPQKYTATGSPRFAGVGSVAPAAVPTVTATWRAQWSCPRAYLATNECAAEPGRDPSRTVRVSGRSCTTRSGRLAPRAQTTDLGVPYGRARSPKTDPRGRIDLRTVTRRLNFGTRQDGRLFPNWAERGCPRIQKLDGYQ